MEEIDFSRWLFEGRSRQGKNVLPDGLNWLCYFAGNSKSLKVWDFDEKRLHWASVVPESEYRERCT